jgi:Ca2+-binding EF-hand superfamily protein
MRTSVLTKDLSPQVPPTPSVASVATVARASSILRGAISRSLSFEQQAEIREEQPSPQPQILQREHASSSQPITWRKARVANAASRWESEIVDAVKPNKKALAAWKEACRLTRVFVYGSFFGMRAPEELSEDDIYLQAVGTREEVEVLFSMWAELDRDRSGRVDYRELERFINVHVKGKVQKVGPAADFAHALLVKIERLLLQKKNSVAIEDFMRLIWPASEAQEIRQMKFWCRELAAQASQATKIRPPTVLPKEDLDALCAIFRRMDTRKSGYVDFETMMANGIVHDYHVDQLRRDWDKNDNGSLDVLGFCEMMCPTGYRVHNLAQIGSTSDGTVVVFDPDDRVWVEQDRSASELIS